MGSTNLNEAGDGNGADATKRRRTRPERTGERTQRSRSGRSNLGLESGEKPGVARTRTRRTGRPLAEFAQPRDERRESLLDSAPGRPDASAKSTEGTRGGQLKLSFKGTADGVQDITLGGFAEIKKTLVERRAMVTEDRRRDATGDSNHTWSPGRLGFELTFERSGKARTRRMYGSLPGTGIALAATAGRLARGGATDPEFVGERVDRARSGTGKLVSQRRLVGASGCVKPWINGEQRCAELVITVAPTWGQTGSAAERLWSAHDTGGLGTDSEFKSESRLEIGAGYGFRFAHGRGVLTPYAGITLGDAGNRTVRTGTRWQLGPDAVLGLEATRQTSDAGEADNQLMLRAALRF